MGSGKNLPSSGIVLHLWPLQAGSTVHERSRRQAALDKETAAYCGLDPLRLDSFQVVYAVVGVFSSNSFH